MISRRCHFSSGGGRYDAPVSMGSRREPIAFFSLSSWSFWGVFMFVLEYEDGMEQRENVD